MIKAQILLAWGAISCGQVLLWRRRDNIFGYLQMGFFFAACVVPLLGTSVVDNAPPEMAGRFADLMTLGALAYVGGLGLGGHVAERSRVPNLTFGGGGALTANVMLTARRLAAGSVAAMVFSLALLGYVPILAADRLLAKYGVGVYAAGFARGSLFYNVSMLAMSTMLPVMMVLAMRTRRLLDATLAFLLFGFLMATLSRQMTFIGPMAFAIALAVHRRWRPWAILSVTCFAYVGSAVFNSLVSITPLGERKPFADQVAAATPDLVDYISFIENFERDGSRYLGFRPLKAALSFSKEAFDPAEYALKIRTGLPDITGLASGGIRLPAAVWGFASFGFVGAACWCLVSGLFVGFGTVQVRRVLTPAFERGELLAPLVLAWVFWRGTWGVLGEWYFLPRVSIIGFGMALMLGVRWGPSWLLSRGGPPGGPPGRQVDDPAALRAPSSPRPEPVGRGRVSAPASGSAAGP